MAYQPRRWTLRTAGLIGAAFAVLILGVSRDAHASSACATFRGSGTVARGGGRPNEAMVFGFTRGDIITGSISGGPDAHIILVGQYNGLPLEESAKGNSFSYSVGSNQTVGFYIVVANGSSTAVTYAYSCTSVR
jgi:hypothetical protein